MQKAKHCYWLEKTTISIYTIKILNRFLEGKVKKPARNKNWGVISPKILIWYWHLQYHSQVKHSVLKALLFDNKSVSTWAWEEMVTPSSRATLLASTQAYTSKHPGRGNEQKKNAKFIKPTWFSRCLLQRLMFHVFISISVGMLNASVSTTMYCRDAIFNSLQEMKHYQTPFLVVTSLP